MASLNRGLGIHFLNLTGIQNELFAVAPALVDAVEAALNGTFRATAEVDSTQLLCVRGGAAPAGGAPRERRVGLAVGGRWLEVSFGTSDTAVLQLPESTVLLRYEERPVSPAAIPVVVRDDAGGPPELRFVPAPANRPIRRCCQMDERTAAVSGDTELLLDVPLSIGIGPAAVAVRLRTQARVTLTMIDAVKAGGPCDPPRSCVDEEVYVTADVEIEGFLELQLAGTVPAALLPLFGAGGGIRLPLKGSERSVFVVQCPDRAHTREGDFED
jgi:hypothetical protein